MESWNLALIAYILESWNQLTNYYILSDRHQVLYSMMRIISPSWKLLFAALFLVLPCTDVTASSSSSSSSKAKTPEDYLVTGLEQVQPAYEEFDGKMYAGLVPFTGSNDIDKEFMFWLFAPDEPAATDTILIWLNGGPGCSSFQCGMLFETSPVLVESRAAGYCCTNDQEPLQANPYAWTQTTYMLYVEQPAGTGWSTGPWPEDENDVVTDFVAWLHAFYDIFTDLQSYKLYIFGERYAY